MEAPTEEAAVAAASAEEPADPATEEVPSAATEDTAAEDTGPTGEEEPVGTTDAGDGVDIPKQQGADEAADSEAGEGART
ncbi:gliding motility protein [Streptomyces sp. XD-27]|uniref:gliding motility protein n=1 Tax=Streptomyces sp. XD-27 TaxID=3062779 RepID=UPI0026F467D5|nr:gliding motility protein [Streptomyces sp. XD-27]WKX72968.1 gliding motility protein [Streptomyces sp. XD-27]